LLPLPQRRMRIRLRPGVNGGAISNTSDCVKKAGSPPDLNSARLIEQPLRASEMSSIRTFA